MNKTCPTVNPYHRYSSSFSHNNITTLPYSQNYDIFKIVSMAENHSLELQVWNKNYVYQRAAYYFFFNFLKQNGQKGQEQMNYFKQYINNNSFLLNNVGDSSLILENTPYSPIELLNTFLDELTGLFPSQIMAQLLNKNNMFDKILIRWVINFHRKCQNLSDVVSLFHKLNFRCNQMTLSDAMIGGYKLSITGGVFRICNFRALNKNFRTCQSQVSDSTQSLNSSLLQSMHSLQLSVKKQSIIDTLVQFLLQDNKEEETQQKSPISFKKTGVKQYLQDNLENTRASTDFSNKSNKSSKSSLAIIVQQEQHAKLPQSRQPFANKNENSLLFNTKIQVSLPNQKTIKPTHTKYEKIQNSFTGYCPQKIQQANTFRRNYVNVPTTVKTPTSEQTNNGKFPLSSLRVVNRSSLPLQQNYSSDFSWTKRH